MQQLYNVYKKIGFIVLTILISTSIYIGTADASSRLYSDLLTTYINKEGNLRLSNQTYANLDLKSNKPNLYLTIYNETVTSLNQQVYEGMSQVTNYSANRLRQFIENGDASVLERRGVIKNINRLAWEAENITTLYNQEKEFFETLANLENKTIAMEIFANGDKSDAGFDLLDDLAAIEKILYDEVGDSAFGPTIHLNGGFLKRSSGVPEGILKSQFGSSINNQDSTTSNSNSVSSQEQNREQAVETLQDIIERNTPSNETSTSANQNFCPIDPSLESALAKFVAEENNSTQLNNTGSNTNNTISEQSNSNNTQNSNINRPPAPNQNRLKDSIVGTLNENPVIAFNNQKQTCPNNATFCFRTELIYNTAESFFPNDTQCLACEVSRMSSASKAIIDGNLMAQKATGNFLEPNVCKRVAFSRLFSFRVNILTRPVLPVQDTVDQVQELSPREIERQARQARAQIQEGSGFSSSSIPSSIDNADGLAGVQEAQATNQSFEQEVVRQRQLIPNITQNLDSLSNLTGGLSTRIQSFTNYLISINEIAIEMNQTLAQIKSKPVCQ